MQRSESCFGSGQLSGNDAVAGGRQGHVEGVCDRRKSEGVLIEAELQTPPSLSRWRLDRYVPYSAERFFVTDGISEIPTQAQPTGASPGVRTLALRDIADLVQQLARSLARLETAAASLQLSPLAGRKWFDLLQRKLLPQLTTESCLIVAVVGGTNTGKSVVFNHIAGFRASASSPLASGTKHPVCLVPEGFAKSHDLQAMFPSFELRPWAGGDEALQDVSSHYLFWRSHEQVPSNLVILDTPDVDSDAHVNWLRTDAVRQAADVLVAVLTQQKYNDAAVKQFFRKAAGEDKAAIIVFNQVKLPDDEQYWPIWLKTFCSETGLNPEYVYLAPNNRKAAEAIALPFEERAWPVGSVVGDEGSHDQQPVAAPASGSLSAISLSRTLSQLRFAEIKLRTLRGSLRFVVNCDSGIGAYLDEIRSRCRQFQDAARIFLSKSTVQQADWPAPSNGLFVEEMWGWWREHREAWTAGIHGFYAQIGGAVRTGIKAIRTQLGHVQVNPVEQYRQQEWEAIVRILQQLYEQLQIITTLDNPFLSERLNRLLSGTSCEAVISRLQQAHDRHDIPSLVRELVQTEMEWLRQERQSQFEVLRKVDGVAAVFRPVLTIGFALGGGIGAEHFLIGTATQALTHLAVDASAAAATTVAGEVVTDASAGMMGQAKASLLRLHEKFKDRREAWLLDQLRQQFLGELLVDLEAGATVAKSDVFVEVTELAHKLKWRMTEIEKE